MDQTGMDKPADKSDTAMALDNKGFVISRERLIYLGLWFIVPFCSYTSHTMLAVPPTLVLFFVGTLILISVSRTAYFSPILLVPLFFITYLMLSQPLMGAPFNRYMGVVFSMLYLFPVVCFGTNLPEHRWRKLIKKFVIYSVVLMVIECIWRLSHPKVEYAIFEGIGDVRWIYQYKFGGLMYVDSNAVAIHLIILLFFVFYLEAERGEKWLITKFILWVLLALTFSRAAWVGAVIGWVYVRFLRKKSAFFFFINFVWVFALLLTVYQVYIQTQLQSDQSFLSKFEIVEKVRLYLSQASFSDFFFGIGLSRSGEVLGIYAHNYFFVFLIESGIIGLLLVILHLIGMVAFTKRSALIILVPFVVTNLSATITFTPYLYVCMGFILLDQRHQFKTDHAC